MVRSSRINFCIDFKVCTRVELKFFSLFTKFPLHQESKKLINVLPHKASRKIKNNFDVSAIKIINVSLPLFQVRIFS